MGLAQRTLTSTLWNIAVNPVKLVIQLTRSILLARWLPVETFGVYGYALAVIGIALPFASLGMASAFMHRAPETEDEEQTAALYFTLKLIVVSIWLLLVIGAAIVSTTGQLRIALIVLALANGLNQLTEVPKQILARRVVHRRLSLAELVSIVASAGVALFLAYNQFTLWALLSLDVVRAIISAFFFFVWRPFWRPNLHWSSQGVRYFTNFGNRVFAGTLLANWLDKLDDLWTGYFLGDTPLGFYGRAYNFARYPRLVVANPVNVVLGGTYAELKHDRTRLSKAFFRSNSLLIRTGFLMAGGLALIAPTFIEVALGAKWLPMLDAFRWMLIYTLIDPFQKSVGSLIIAAGQPEARIWIRLCQLAVLLIGLFTLGNAWGITGVAIAVNLMLIVGIVLLLWKARSFVDFSLWRLFAAPVVALGVAMMAAQVITFVELPTVSIDQGYFRGVLMAVVFTLIYSAVLLILEFRQIQEVSVLLKRHLLKR